MQKVQCENCGEIGYTAAPKSLVCECGGKFKEVPQEVNHSRVEPDEGAQRFINLLMGD